MSTVVVPPSPRPATDPPEHAPRRGDHAAPPRLRLVSRRGAQGAGDRGVARGHVPAGHPDLLREGHLRLVAGGSDAGTGGTPGVDGVVARVPGRTAPPPRRPGPPLALRASVEDLERMAPRHPAVRAARRRLPQAGAAAGGGASGRRPAAWPGGSEPLAGSRRAASGAAPEAPAALPVPVRRLLLGLAACLAALLLLAAGILVSALTSPGYTETTTAVVRPGQTLWEVASATGAADVTGTVAEIVELNDLEDPTVYAGQHLVVPVVVPGH